MSDAVDLPSAIIVFDGSCVLCSRWTRFVLRFDRQAHFHLAAMQTEIGRQLMLAHGLDPDNPASFVVVDNGHALRDSAALLHVLRHCGWFWRGIGGLLRVVPRSWRDAGYRLIANKRYQWFGQHAVCIIPDMRQQQRFLR
jgi:predicted DCC family thiol-disulfide oxidoreductase YuxK